MSWKRVVDGVVEEFHGFVEVLPDVAFASGPPHVLEG